MTLEGVETGECVFYLLPLQKNIDKPCNGGVLFRKGTLYLSRMCRLKKRHTFKQTVLHDIQPTTYSYSGLFFYIQGLVIERIGRRPLLIFGFSAMAVCFSLLTVFLNFQVSLKAVFASLMKSSH